MAQPACNNILVIEDDQPIREAIQESLEMEGYTVTAVENGKEGLEALKKRPCPCLILLDLMLPIMNGWEFLDELRKNQDVILAAIPVVITSAAGHAAKTATDQAQGFIRKPIDLDLLLKTVEKYCA